MTIEIDRRDFVRFLLAGAAAGSAIGSASFAWAQGADAVTVGWPSDVPTWDPNQRFVPDAQSIYKLVFDQPLDQSPSLELVPRLFTKWELSPDGLSLAVEIRDDVAFHNGDKMTMDDVRYTFFERVKAGHEIDMRSTWGHIEEIEIHSPTNGVFKFKTPSPTAAQWMAFLGSYVVPKKYMEQVGVPGFREKPIGTGPYKLVDYQLNSRLVFERNEDYWGEKPAIRRVTFEVIKDTSARVAAIQSGQVDITVAVPVREMVRLGKNAALAAESLPITRIILVQARDDLAFADVNVRMAAHHAIDKAALSKAFYNNTAVPLAVAATPGTPGYIDGFTFEYSPEKAKELLAKSGFSTDKPARFRFATTNGHFPSDFDIARAIVQMWKKVGIEAELETIEYAKYFELNRGGKLPEATLYSWDNATGDPEIFTGYLMNPKMPTSAWKSSQLGDKIVRLFSEPNYEKRIAEYRAINEEATKISAIMPLLQSVQTIVHKKSLAYTKYDNGWVLANTMKWS